LRGRQGIPGDRGEPETPPQGSQAPAHRTSGEVTTVVGLSQRPSARSYGSRRWVHDHRATSASIWGRGTAPTMPSIGWPFLKRSIVGIDVIRNRSAVRGLSLTFSFPRRRLV